MSPAFSFPPPFIFQSLSVTRTNASTWVALGQQMHNYSCLLTQLQEFVQMDLREMGLSTQKPIVAWQADRALHVNQEVGWGRRTRKGPDDSGECVLQDPLWWRVGSQRAPCGLLEMDLSLQASPANRYDLSGWVPAKPYSICTKLHPAAQLIHQKATSLWWEK